MKNSFFKLQAALLMMSGIASAQVTQPLENFDRISISRSTKILIKQGSSSSVTAATQEELDNAQYRQTGNRLVFNGNSSGLITVTTPELKQLDISGNGNISNDGVLQTKSLQLNISGNGITNLNIDAGEVEYNVSGNCTGTLKGKANNLQLNVAGRLNIEADSLVVSRCEASVSGMANFKADIRDELNTYVSGKANIQSLSKPAKMNSSNSGIAHVGVADSNYKEIPDTSKLEFGTSSVWIIHKKSNNDFNMDRLSQFHFAGLEFGFDNYVDEDFSFSTPENYDYLELRTGKSVVVNLNIIQGAFKLANRHVMIGSGLGFSFMNYRFTTDNQILVPNAPEVTADSSDISYDKYKLAVDYISVPLLFQFNTSKYNENNFFVSMGVIANYKIGSRVKLKENGDKAKIYDEFNLNPFKFDARLSIGYNCFSLFATYSINEMFKNNQGPELHPVSFGVALSGF